MTGQSARLRGWRLPAMFKSRAGTVLCRRGGFVVRMFAMQETPLKVLLIEHDEAFARAVVEMFRQSPLAVEVKAVHSLQDGLGELEVTWFGVVILEFFLPDGAGLANIGLLRVHAPRVPVIVVGAADNEAFAVEAMHAGAQDYLVKGQVTQAWLLRSVRYATERNTAEMALQDAEEKYRGIFDHLVEGIFQTSPDGQYLLANTALARIYGYNSPEELMQSVTDIGRTLYVLPRRRDEFIRVMQESDTVEGFESQIYRKDGKVIWIRENCRAIRDGQGRLLYYEGTVEDITLRRKAEEKLRDSEALYHSLVESLPQCIFRKDLEGHYTFANQAFCRMVGKSYDEIIGKRIYDFFPASLAEKREKNDQQVVKSGKPFEQIEENRFSGGRHQYIQVVKSPMRDANGRIIGVQGVFWDITHQRLAAERIRKANAELTRSQEELRLKNLQMEEDLKMAREIQLAMLPQQYPTLPRNVSEEQSAFRFTHRYNPTGAVGGDFFSLTALSDNEVGVFICDVAGHGVRSALVTAMIRALIEELNPLAGDPGAFMTKLNSELCAILRHAGMPVLTTAFYLIANAETGALRYTNAGHPRPLHLQRAAGRVEPLGSGTSKKQPALGIFDKAPYATSTSTLAPHDLIMLFTDGLFEVHDSNEELYTQEMVGAAVSRRLQLPAAQLFDELIAEIRGFALDHAFGDDVCLVGMEWVAK